MKVVVVGGGTAGWLAALVFSKLTKTNVTVIESSKIGIIGAGEGSTGSLTNVLQNITGDYGCNELDFIKECDGTPKLGIHHRNWKGDGTSYIAPIDGPITSAARLDSVFCHQLTNNPTQMHLTSEDGYLIENDLDPLSLPSNPSAYHFNAHKVGKYFKKICGRSVTHIDSEVTNVHVNEKGYIKSVDIANGKNIEGDFFVDASGFRRLLMTKLGVKWKSYSEYLPVNSAMPFLLPYEEDEIISPLTTAWAQDSGWMWQIPTLERRGCGYVYSDEFISDDEAHAEIESRLGKKIEPIKFIKFDSGRLETLWEKNCLSVGLCAAFAEPLEATSIHTTITQLEFFVKEYFTNNPTEIKNPHRIKHYNDQIGLMYDLLRDFLILHYKGKRTDTKFWEFMDNNKNTDQVDRIIEMCKHKIPNSETFPNVIGNAGWPLWSLILAGLGYIKPELARKELALHGLTEAAKQDYENYIGFCKMNMKDLPSTNDTIRKRMNEA